MRKPFSIEAAKSGAKVVTRDGRAVEILKYDYKDDNYPIVAMITNNDEKEIIGYFTVDGCFYSNRSESCFDLFIEVESIYRPYKPMEDMDEAIMKHGLVVVCTDTGKRYTITGYCNARVYIGDEHANVSYNRLLKEYKWLDGTPCGVQEGG